MIILAGVIGITTLALFFMSALATLKTKGSMTAPIAILIVGLMATASVAVGYPKYLIWQQEQEGAAELAKAEQNRQIAIQEARAKEESAKSLANAEVIRAEGLAKANEIVIQSLGSPDAYIHYLWIDALKESHSSMVYVPTEASLPITEANRQLAEQK